MLADKPAVTPASDQEDPSIPLYVAGFLVTAAALQSINMTSSENGQADAGITVLLAAIGHVFSVGCRLFRIRTYLPEILGVAALVYIVYGAITGALNPVAFAAGGNESQLELAKALGWVLVAMSWALVSDGLVVFMGLLSVAAIGVIGSLNLNTPVIGYFALYIFAMLFLLVHHHYLQIRTSAPPAERNRDQSRPLILQVAVAGFCTLAVFLAGSLVIVPEQMLFANMSLARAIRGLAGLTNGSTASTAQGPYISDDADLSVGTGSGWNASTEIVAHVTPSDRNSHYWRARSYDKYTGVGWTSSLSQERVSVDPVRSAELGPVAVYNLPMDYQVFPLGGAPGAEVSAARPQIVTQVDLKARTSEFFYAAEPVRVALEGRAMSLAFCKDGNLEQEAEQNIRGRYRVQSLVTPSINDDGVPEKLRHASTKFPSTVRFLYVGDVANDITTDDDVAFFRHQVKLALRKLGPGQQTEYDRALAIQEYVSQTAVYSLTVPPLPPDTDHVREFLGTARKGYCDMFASSMAVLCRAAGIPARVATGFAPGVPAGDGYDLRAMDKHAWTEVYFPGYGWVVFDATTNAQTDGSENVQKPKAKPTLAALWRKYIANNPIVMAVFGMIVLIVAYVGVTEFRDRRRRQSGGRDRDEARTILGRTYQQVTAALGRIGLGRRLSETPNEYLNRMQLELPDAEKRLRTPLPAAPVAAITERFVAARYADQHTDVSDLAGTVNAFLKNARKARWRYLLQRLMSRRRKA